MLHLNIFKILITIYKRKHIDGQQNVNVKKFIKLWRILVYFQLIITKGCEYKKNSWLI